MFDFLPEWVKIFFMSMIPWLESRYVIPYAVLFMRWKWWMVFPVAVAGNMVPVPFVLIFLGEAERFLSKFRFWRDVMDKVFFYTRRRADRRIKRYKHLGLLFFVAVPLPFTGAWTGTLVAYLFDLKLTKSLITISIGVLIAALTMTIVTLTLGNIFGLTFT